MRQHHVFSKQHIEPPLVTTLAAQALCCLGTCPEEGCMHTHGSGAMVQEIRIKTHWAQALKIIMIQFCASKRKSCIGFNSHTCLYSRHWLCIVKVNVWRKGCTKSSCTSDSWSIKFELKICRDANVKHVPTGHGRCVSCHNRPVCFSTWTWFLTWQLKFRPSWHLFLFCTTEALSNIACKVHEHLQIA